MAAERFPLEPLTVWVHTQTVREFRDALGLSKSQLRRARVNGLTLAMADVCALRAGLHPVMVWPEQYPLEVDDELVDATG